MSRLIAYTTALFVSLASVTLAADHGGPIRSELAEVSVRALPTERGSNFRLPLFGDVGLDLTVRHVSRRPSGMTLQVSIDGDAFGSGTITIEDGVVAAGFWTERGIYSITPEPNVAARDDGSGVALVRVAQLQPQSTVRCMPVEHDRANPQATPAHAVHEHRPRPDNMSQGPAASRTPRSTNSNTASRAVTTTATPPAVVLPCNCSDDQSIVDVLCVYTTLAKNAAGGAANLQARFQNAIDAANAAFTNSGINTGGVNRLQLRVAGYAEVTYDEAAPQWINHLQRVTETADGFMDNVHALRDAANADTVALAIDDTRFIGGAAWWAIWDQKDAFACVNWRTLGGGDLLLAHEIGHNFGCAHDYENDASAPTSYARGHYFTHNGQTYGTIMSYPGTIRLPMFSNPNIIAPGTNKPAGVPVGQPRAAYDALMIQQTRWTLANYRDAAGIIDCNANGIDDATDIATLLSDDANGDCRPDDCEEKRFADAVTPGPGEGRTWANAGADLGEILAISTLRCSNISQVWVAGGSYKPGSGTTYRGTSFPLRSGLSIYGGFRGKSRPGGGETSLAQRTLGVWTSTLDGNIGNAADETDNAYSVVTGYDVAANARLDGFTITGGYSDFSGAGVFLRSAAPTIANCVFTGNRAGYGGGLLADTASNVLLKNCIFHNNTATGGGGAISAYTETSITVENSQLSHNSAAWGGAIASESSAIIVKTSRISRNIATTYNGGGIDVNNSTLNVYNALISDNTAEFDGAGLWIANDSSAGIRNTTIAGNSAATYTGGATVYFANATFTNAVIWGNSGGQADTQDKNLVYFGTTNGTPLNSSVQGWNGSLGGVINNANSPLFVNPFGGNYRLGAGSLCINTGDNTVLLDYPLDLAGQPRRNGVIDRGAFEYVVSNCPADLNSDGFVDDADFSPFASAYNVLDCADVAMPPDCLADLNHDGYVDDGDFVFFAVAYDALLCP
ncbi:MAG TPA: M12 family metallo-peptidase [Phycisphaerales bacterium]